MYGANEKSQDMVRNLGGFNVVLTVLQLKEKFSEEDKTTITTLSDEGLQWLAANGEADADAMEGKRGGQLARMKAARFFNPLHVLANGAVTEEELARAKAATVSSILMNLESKAIVAEDIGRQILTYGERKAPSEFIAQVNALTVADVAAVAVHLDPGRARRERLLPHEEECPCAHERARPRAHRPHGHLSWC